MLRFFVSPPIPHPSRHHNTTMSQFPAYQHSFTHQIYHPAYSPWPPLFHLPPLPIYPPCSPTRSTFLPTAFLVMKPPPPASPRPSPLLYSRPLPKRSFSVDLCVSSSERTFKNSCAPPLRSVMSCTRSLRCPQAPWCGGRPHRDGKLELPDDQVLSESISFSDCIVRIRAVLI